MNRIAIAALVVAVSLVAFPHRAHACWDGHYAHVGNVELMGGGEGEEWSAAQARELATWLGRIDALLPRDGSGTVRVEWGTATVAIGEVETTFTWNGRSMAALFRGVAAVTRADLAMVRAAMSTAMQVTTVEAAAFASRARAEALAAQIAADGRGEHGFLEVGGFPAENPVVHIVEGADAGRRRIFRVVVGAFVDVAEAERVRVAVGASSVVRSL